MWTLIYASVISFVYLTKTVDSKIFERCELARELKSNYDLSNHEAAMFTCIAEKQSSLDTRALGSTWGTQFHGLFQLSDEYWCSAPGTKGYVCGVACDKFRDDDIRDDFTCARYSIYDEHQRISGDGFNAWPSNAYCKANVYEYLSCLSGDTSNYIGSKALVTRPAVTKAAHRPVIQGRAKIYDNCELAQDLVYKHDIPMQQVATWVCIAYHESRYNTSALGQLNWDGSGDHGLFQISDLFWCGPGKACGLSCDDLKDDDIADDVRCIKRIHAEHTRLSGDGFTAWAVYPRCRGDVSSYTNGCFTGDQNEIAPVRPRPGVTAPPKPTYRSKSASTGKVYTKCDLAQELYNKHNIPFEQVPTWVCIAHHESSFNTSAVGRLNWDGSEDHGLFQISDIYWCTHGSPGKACGVSCEDLRDDDISDDIRCIKQIHEEHTRLSGDGFNAWTVYPRCRGDVSSYVEGCFSGSQNQIVPSQPSRPNVPRPGVTAPPKPSYKPKSASTGKVYTKCDLAQELYHKHNIPFEQIPTWVCIAKHESSFNTSAVGRLNWDGSEDHGLFQISDIYWCTHGSPGKACGLACEDLRDDDISDDVRCIKQIHEEHTRLSGDGFNAWTVYSRCRGDLSSYIDKCFKDEKITSLTAVKPRPTVTGPPRPQVNQQKPSKTIPKGKVYTKCELAQDLYYKYNLPWDQIPTWVCIAKHESSFNTSAIGILNWDGSEDHGLFQISDIYWCDHGRRGKACNLACSDLEDGDITDDVECIKQIHDEHTLLSGDGFNAWTVYPRNCKGRSESYVSECFVESTTKTVTTSKKSLVTTTKRPITTTTTTKRPTTTTRFTTTTRPTTTTRRTTTTTRRPTTTTRFTTTTRPTTTTTRPTTTTRRTTSTTRFTTTTRPTTTTRYTTTTRPTTTTRTTTTTRPTTTTTTKRPTTTTTTTRRTTSTTRFTTPPTTTRFTTTTRPITTTRPTTSTTTTRRTTTTTRFTTTTRPTTTTRVTTKEQVPTFRQNPNRIEENNKSSTLVKQNQYKLETTTKKSLYSFYLTDFGKTSKTLPTFKPFSFQNPSKPDKTSKKTSDSTKKAALVQKTTVIPSWNSYSTKSTTRTTQHVPFTNQKVTQTKGVAPRSTQTETKKSPSPKSLKHVQSTNEVQKTDDKPKNAWEYYVKYVLGGKPVTVAPYNFDYIKGLTRPTLRSS